LSSDLWTWISDGILFTRHELASGTRWLFGWFGIRGVVSVLSAYAFAHKEL